MAENGTTIAKAYVQIMPSALGIKTGLGKEMGGAGASAGQSFGSKMAGAIKGVLATAAIGKALSAAISEGAALEQSLGGIETLFKGSADTVIANAQNAYRTAGLSANAYMESVTGFSARLLQGLGGDTQAAAALADKAMVDMADNANKMGTDMATIQQTYQSLARGNYEMLDNLKLGYGGTQAEMARLINDSGVLGDTMVATAENVNSIGFDKMIEAIHVVQDEMGITGTTALEAATTLTGSLNAMKASFQNVLGSLTLGQDVAPALNALAQTVTTFLTGNLLPAVWNVLSALPGALVTFTGALVPQLAAGLAAFIPQVAAQITAAAPQMLAAAQMLLSNFALGVSVQLPVLLQSGVQMVQQLVAGAVQNLPALLSTAGDMISQFASTILSFNAQIISAGLQTLASLVTGVLQGLPSLIAAAGELLMNFVNSFLSNLPQVWEAGVQTVLQLVNGIISNLPSVLSSAAQAVARFVAGVGQNLPQILQTGITMLGRLAAGLIQAIPNLIGQIPAIISGIVNAFLGYDWLSIGANIMQGIGSGIMNAVGSIISAAQNALGQVVGAVKGFLGIASPSKVMRDQVGRFIPLGIAEGIADNTAPLRAAMQDAADQLVQPVRGTATLGYSAAWQPAYAAPGAGQGAGTQQTFNFYQPVQTPDEFARAVRIQTTYGLAGAR